MQITYIDHSSFLVELEQHYLLFDYVQGELPQMDLGKKLVVFVSHRHGDHFSPLIFDLIKVNSKIVYVISDDIWQNQVPEEIEGKVLFLGADEEEHIADLTVRTYQSTDEGVAFMVYVEGKTIYHAGDLNHWNWIGEPDEWNQRMGESYHKELDKMSEEDVDVAFLPVDSRLKENFFWGVDDFMKQVGARIVFPMHFWGDFAVCAKLKALPEAEDYKERVMEIEKQGQVFWVEDVRKAIER